MKKSELSRLLDSKESGMTFEIRKNGIDDYEIVREIENFGENNYPGQYQFRSTSFVSISTQGKQSFYGMDKKPSSRIPKNYDNQIVIGMFQTLLSYLPVIEGKVNSVNGKYNTKKVGDYTGFYGLSGKLHYVLFEGKKYNNIEKPDKLETHVFKSLEEVR